MRVDHLGRRIARYSPLDMARRGKGALWRKHIQRKWVYAYGFWVPYTKM